MPFGDDEETPLTIVPVIVYEMLIIYSISVCMFFAYNLGSNDIDYQIANFQKNVLK